MYIRTGQLPQCVYVYVNVAIAHSQWNIPEYHATFVILLQREQEKPT